MRTLFLSTLAFLLSATSAFAGQVSIKNCGHKAVDVVAYNDNDGALLIGASSTRIAVGETKTLHCKTSFCNFRIDSHIIKPYKDRTYHIYWPHFHRTPDLKGFCKMADPPKKGSLHVKNCTPRAITLYAYNGDDGSRAVAFSHATLQPNEIKHLTCATEYCHLKVDGYELYKYKGSIQIHRPYNLPLVSEGHVCKK